MDAVAALLLVGLGQGLLLAGLLLVRRDLRSASTLFLAGLIAAVTLSGLEDAALRFGWLADRPELAGLSLLLLPFVGPCLRGHCEAVLDADWRLRHRHWYWFVSIGLGLAFAVLFLMQPSALRLSILTDTADPDDPAAASAALALIVVYLITALAVAVALFTSYRDLRARTRGVEVADPMAARLVWLRGLIGLSGLAWLAYAASLLAGLIPGLPAATVQSVSSVVQVATLYGIGLIGLVQPDRMLPPPGEIVAAILAPASAKYGRAALAPDERARLAKAIERAMHREKLYRDPLLSLPRLASAVGSSPNDVSQVLNAHFGLGYHDYVSRLRVAEAKRILNDPDRTETLLEILLEVGFNSKSVFNAAFKRETGLTPSEFRRRALSADQTDPAR
ncbi:MAG: helix-turn-helix domain-containing protein [Tabrizicola sp.]